MSSSHVASRLHCMPSSRERLAGLSSSTPNMENRRLGLEPRTVQPAPPPSYYQACAPPPHHPSCSLCHAFYTYAQKDPIIVVITLAATIGSFCLLSGLLLLCIVSKTLRDETSEAILLLGIGFFISAVACVAWQLTKKQRLTRLIEAIKEEAV